MVTLQSLSSQVSPNFPSLSLRGPDTVPVLDSILATKFGGIVHIRSDADAIRLAEFVSQYLRIHSSTPIEIHRFDFNMHDIRFSNITIMLRTWLCQLAFRTVGSSAWPTQRSLLYMRALQAWTGNDLIQFWLRYIIDDCTSNIIFVVGGFEQCDRSRENFISSLKKIFAEREIRLRIVFTTTKGHDADTKEQLQVSLPQAVCQELKVDSSHVYTEHEDEKRLRIALLFHHLPRYVNTLLEPWITDILGSSELDEDLKHVASSWLACDHITLDIMERHLSSLTPPTPELLFECILSDMPKERQNWARQLLFGVLHSVRALRTEEFWVLSQIILNDRPEDSIQGLLRWFGGLLRIENDEVQLGHPLLRAWLDSGHVKLYSCTWWRYESKREGHLDILKACLECLRDSGRHVYRSVPSGPHSLPYAVQYWHIHYEEVYKESVHNEHEALVTSARQMALELFSDTKSFQDWIEAYICMTDQFTAPDPSSKRPFPMASYLGLHDIVNVLEKEYPEDLPYALIEAARKGHLEIVRHLVLLCTQQFRLAEPTLEQIIKAATSCGNDEVVGQILTLIERHNLDSESRPTWISEMFLKACWLGNEQLVDILANLGADLRTPMRYTDGDIRPLHLAVQTNKIVVIKMLLKRDNNLCLDDPVLPGTLSAWGSQEVAELLLANGFKAETVSGGELTALEVACLNGRPEIADLLLTQTHNSVDYIDPGSIHPLIRAA